MWTLSATALREAFDHSFAQAIAPNDDALDDHLALRLAQAPYAVRLAEVACLLPWREPTFLPSSVPALMGLMSHRGSLLPVYDLPAVMGHGPRQRPPEWLLIVAGRPLAFAVDVFEAHLRLPRRMQDDTVAAPDGLRPLIPLTALAAAMPASHPQAVPTSPKED